MMNKNDEFDPEIELTDEDGESTLGDKIKKLKTDLKTAKEESTKNLDGWQRALADYANLQKESGNQIKELREYVAHGFIEELFPVLDSFEMAMKDKKTWEAVSENWRKGVEYIYNKVKGILSNNGIEAIEKVGEKFNPDYHATTEEVPTDDAKLDHTVAEIIQKGYKSSKGIIRPAQVKIFIKN